MASRWARGAGITLAAIATLLLAAAVVFAVSSSRLSRRLAIAGETIPVPTDSASIARGAHLASAIGKCTDCHGENLGGQVMDMGPVGTFAAVNLTRGEGGIGEFSEADWVRAIRHGVARDGRPLVFMPSRAYAALNAPDLAALIAYLRSVPPVDHQLSPGRVGPVGRFIIATDPGRLIAAAVLGHAAPLPEVVPAGPTAEYGRYLTVIGGCVYCHGDNLHGGIKEGPPGTPASADLTPTGPTGTWSATDFAAALRTGQRPDGTILNPFMPWRLTRLMTDEEIAAVWAYLRTL